MKWKKRPSEVFLLVFTFLFPTALCNQKTSSVERVNESRQHGADSKRSLVPGHQTAILQNGHVIHLDHLRLLDPYNLIASIKQNGNKLSPVLAELLPQNSLVDEENLVKGNHKRRKENKSKGLSSSPENDKFNNADSLGFVESETNNSTRSKEESYFDESDFNLYDDYDIDTPKTDDISVSHKTKVGRRQKKGSPRNSNTKEHNALLHEAVRKLLGFSQSNKWSPKNRRLLPDPFGQERIPRYVKDLYERFQSGEMNAGLAQGNTIRSIHTSVGQVEGESMFLFNLSSLRPSEHLLNAEIHLYKRRPRSKGQLKLDIEVKLYRVAGHYLSEVGRITMRNDVSHGWLWYDVTNAVQNCLTPRRRHEVDLFALSFRVIKPNGKIKSVSLRKFGRHHSKPFLVLYSNETEAVSFEQLDILTERLWPKENGRNHEVHSHISRGRKSISEHTPDAEENQTKTGSRKLDGDLMSTFSHGDLIGDSGALRNKRSIYDNEIPENPVDGFDDYAKHRFINTVPQTHPGILTTRKESRIDLKSHPSLLPLPRYYGNSNDDKASNIQRKRRKKHHRNKKYNQRRNRLPFPKEWDAYASEMIKANKNDNVNSNNINGVSNKNKPVVDGDVSANVCGRRRLTVDFADIGWGDWIISPKSFEAHYCAGSCPFPLNKRLHPSNHATIQSIVHAIGIQGNVPAPCCVPDKMSSVTLLYFDEDRNVVLKNYPGMTVESCACR